MNGLRLRLEAQELPQLSPACIDKILYLVELENFLQILYSYRIDTLRTINGFFEDEEEYAYCVMIKRTVDKQRKATGKNYTL